MSTNRNTKAPAVFITGTSTGIGAACAYHLDKLGFKVFAGIRKQEDGKTLTQSSAGRITPVLIDITDAYSIADAVDAVTNLIGDQGLAGLINNAGIIIEGPLELVSIKLLSRQFDVNVFGQIAVTQAFLPLLRLGGGRIINIGAATGRVAIPMLGPIASSKAALESMTDALRMELRPWNIPVSIIEPGAMQTTIFQKSARIADQMMENLHPSVNSLYTEAIAAVRKSLTSSKPSSPEIVVTAITEALTAKQPKTRYTVGADARILTALRFLPDRLRDNLLIGQMGLSKIPSAKRTIIKNSLTTRR